MGLGVVLHHRVPAGMLPGAALGGLLEDLADLLRDQEARLLGPAQSVLGGGQLLLSGRLSVRLGGILPGGQSVADVGAADDQGGTVLRFGLLNGPVDLLQIVSVLYLLDVPAVGPKPGG